MNIVIGVLFFVIGTVLASFTNVLIYRLPRQESIVKPASHCPECLHPLKWYDNIPLLSYAMLGGRCRYCRARISPRYLLVELAGGLMSLACFLRFGLSVDGIVGALTLIVLLAVAIIDAEHMIIPLSLNVSLAVLAGVKLGVHLILDRTYPFVHYLAGFGLVAVLLLAVYLLSRLVSGREGLGLGDVILFSVAGLYLAWPGALAVLIGSSLVCTVTMLILIVRKKIDRRQPLGFGPFIAGAFALMIFVEQDLLALILASF